ncbi:hypothetical protein AB0N73_04045 [Microbacterium sp. NPDC089189]|uniref:hypothetical protein n=1 Tax=Microbacterium sp. NPDC089189 TaxID=3154972 RepID=UPI00341AB266
MSILLFDQTETDVLLITDTLVVDHDDKPTMFQHKVWTLPQMNMAIAATGTANVALTWRNVLSESFSPEDIEGLNDHAPAALRAISAHLAKENGPLGRTTIYHFGFPTGSHKLVRYIYRSQNNFEPERFEGSQFGAKPAPPGLTFERPEGREETIALAERLRDENVHRKDEGGVPIGGDLFATLVTNGSSQTVRWHRFSDYSDTRYAMSSFAAKEANIC